MLKVNTEELPAQAARYHVQGIPNFVVVHDRASRGAYLTRAHTVWKQVRKFGRVSSATCSLLRPDLEAMHCEVSPRPSHVRRLARSSTSDESARWA